MKRKITLMIYTEEYKDTIVNELKEFCKNENIPFTGEGSRGPHIYDFVIHGNTEDYKKLIAKYGNRIRETYYAELGNVFDLNQESFEKWQEVLGAYRKKALSRHNLLRAFCNLIKDEKDVRKLEHLTRYSMEESAKTILQDKISQLKGEKTEWERYMDDCLEIDNMVGILKETKEGKYVLKENDLDFLIDILMKFMKYM